MKANIVKLLLVFLLAFLAVSSFSTLKLWAQTQFDGQSLEVSPPSQDMVGDPGETVTVVAKVRNKNNAKNTVKVRLEDFTAQGDEGQVALVSNSPYSVAKWSTVTPDSFQLDPGEVKTVTAKIVIPKTAAGGRYGSFVFSLAPDKDRKSVV